MFHWIPADHFSFLPAKEKTLPALLRNSGYQTAHFGKWHLSFYSEGKDGFKFSGASNQPSMKEYGYDYWFATGNVARPSHKNPKNFFLNGKPMGEMKGFSAQLVAEQFNQWMRNHYDKNEPFFITVWFHEPHGPVDSDPRFVEQYKKLKKDPSLCQYLANITQIDTAVGTMVETLKSMGSYDNTLIWYTSDNGPEGPHGFGDFNQSDSAFNGSRYRGSTGGLRGRKRHTHEGGIRVPGIISWPAGLSKAGVKSGSICAEPIVGSDVFPTMLELAGLKPPEDVVLDGGSIVPLLRKGNFKRKRPLYWRNNYYDFRIGLRDGRWKIVGTSNRKTFELYDLYSDPRETTDLSKLETDIFESMKKLLIDYDKEVLAEGPDWWKRDKRVKKNMPVE